MERAMITAVTISVQCRSIFRQKGRRLFKRFLDLTLTIPGLILISPILIAIAIWIKLDSPGPVFFRQERVGRMKQSFRIYKFRTMVNHAETMGEHITVAGDLRITRSGRILRQLKLDELPQLFNVIKGEMSLVGPRPLVPEQVEDYPEKFQEKVLSVAPGITGLASLAYINESEILSRVSNPQQYYLNVILPNKIGFYIYYIHHYNLRLDLKIIFVTLIALIPIRMIREFRSGLKELKEAQQYAASLIPDQSGSGVLNEMSNVRA